MTTRIPTWVQQAFLSPNVTELTITLGIIAEPEHFQWEVELRNPVDGTLLDLQAMPAGSLDRWTSHVLDCVWIAEEMIERQYGATGALRRAPSLRESLQRLGHPPPRSADPFP